MIEFRFLNSPDDIQEANWCTTRKDTGPAGYTARIFSRGLISEHSPIRRLILSWRNRNMERRASTHFVRHIHSPAFVGGSRPDWFGEAPDTNDHLQDSNCQALIDMARKRLCARAWIGTQENMVELKKALMAADVDRIGPRGDAPPAFYRVLGRVLVPNCVYRCGCPEGKKNCGFWQVFVDKALASGACLRDFLSIERRYELYNVLYFGPEEGDKSNG